MFRKDVMVSSPFDERVRYIYAQAQEVENIISRIEGVVFVRVVLTGVDVDSLARDRNAQQMTAAVYVKHVASAELPSRIAELRALVARALPVGEEDRVAVYLEVVRSAASTRGSAHPSTPPYSWWPGAAAVMLLLAGGAVYWIRRLRAARS